MTFINTRRLREAGKDILTYSDDLNDKFDKLFSKIQNINDMDGSWSGLAASRFVTRANIDSIQYNNLYNKLKKYGNHLIKAADEFDAVIEEVKLK